ncbi:MAG: ABC transporter substrate-binding protein [Bacteroidales bacterium]|nr:ABC transporter substrate-binding protein [Bacteroidales bacterium]
MKKFLRIAVFAAALFASLSVSAKERNQILKVYNWSDYIAEGVVEDFEKWYFEQTGEEIEVIYMTFDVNESMLSKIENGHEDYDVVCPSDYIIERMLNTGLILPLDFSALGNTPNYIEANRSPYIEKMFRAINPDIDANLYSVAYMWGTTGILYNTAFVTREEASTWDVIRNPKFSGKILIKDAPRDVYGPVLIYLKQEELRKGAVTLQDLMMDSSDESVEAVKNYLLEVKPGVCGWEADLGKEQMTKNRAYVSLNWSGDAKWAMGEAESVGVSLDYVVPEEGSTVWFDGWVIPKYSKNTKAALYWINFLCRPDIAIRNFEEMGYSPSCGAPEVLEAMIDEELYAPVDLSYFFGEDAKAVCVDPVLFPDMSVIERCALEHDWGRDTEKLLSMWQDVKGSRASAATYIVIAAVVIAAAAYFAVSAASKRSRRSRKRR